MPHEKGQVGAAFGIKLTRLVDKQVVRMITLQLLCLFFNL